MNNSIRGLRALFSALLLGVGLSAYAARLDPISEHLTAIGLTGSGSINLGDEGGAPCVSPHLDGGDQASGAGDTGLVS